MGLIFQFDAKIQEGVSGNFGRCESNVFLAGTLYRRGLPLDCRDGGYRSKAKSSSHLPPNMYNLGASDFTAVQQHPALKRDLPERDLSAISREYQRTLQPKRNTATSWKQEQ